MSFTEIGMRLGVWLIQIYMGGGVCGDQLAGDFIVCGTLPVVRRSCYSLVCVFDYKQWPGVAHTRWTILF